MMHAKNVLVLSATASAINVIKSLQDEPDIRLFVSDISRYASGLYQDRVTPVVMPPARAREQYRAALDRVILEHKIDILIPTSDRDVEGVVTLLHKGWNPPVCMFRPSFEVQQLISNKLALAKRVCELGLPAPATWGNLDDATFPAVVKPLREGGGRGVFVVRNRREAEEAVRHCRRFGGEFLSQEYVPGGIGSTYVSLLLYDQRGVLVANDVMRSSLTYFTWGGGGNAGYLCNDEDIANTSREIIEAVGGWQGPLNLEFRRNQETGKIYLIEGNCRLNGYSYLTSMNGANYPRAIVDLLSGKDVSLSLARRTGTENFILGFRETVVDAWAEIDPKLMA